MIYQLKVTLEHVHPSTWKRIQVKSGISFYTLHQILQIVFSWDDDHLHVFDVSSLPDYRRKQGKSKVGMNNDTRMIFQSFFGERDEKIYIGDAKHKLGFGKEYDERNEILSDWVTEEKQKLRYTYDFGDNWKHQIVLEKMMQSEHGVKYPRCVKISRGVSKAEDDKEMQGINKAL